MHENPEDKLLKWERLINQLETAIQRGEQLISEQEKEFKDLSEIDQIINGLYKKANELAEEDKKLAPQMPESDEEWDSWVTRTERIQKVYEMIDKLEEEAKSVQTNSNKISAEIDNLLINLTKEIPH